MDAALAADGVDRDDVRVVQRGRRPRLVVEALQLPRVHRRRERQHLQGHAPAQRHLLRLVHHAHAAAAHLADQPEVAELAQGLLRRHRPRDPGDDRPRPLRSTADEAQGRQAGVEVLGQLGVAGQELLARRRGARFARPPGTPPAPASRRPRTAAPLCRSAVALLLPC